MTAPTSTTAVRTSTNNKIERPNLVATDLRGNNIAKAFSGGFYGNQGPTMATIEEQTASISESGGSNSPFSTDHYAVQHNHHHLAQSPRPLTPPLISIGEQFPLRQPNLGNVQQQQHVNLPPPQVSAQQQQHQIFSTPWTLGSTDGTLETSVDVLSHQLNHSLVGTDPAVVLPNSNGGPMADPAAAVSPPSDAFSTGAMIAVNTGEATQALLSANKSLYQDRLFHQSSASVEAVLAASCEVMGFDIAEMWLRTGPKTHQLTNSHLRPTALEDSVRNDLVDVYYGEKSSERTHRLSPALCKKAKEAGDVVWVTAHSRSGAEALRCSISNVRTAVAVPVCHETSNTNITIIFFSIRRIVVRPTSVEFLVHMSLAAGVASVNSLAEEGLELRNGNLQIDQVNKGKLMSKSEHIPTVTKSSDKQTIRHQRAEKVSVTGARLDLQWRQLANVEYLTDGGNSWIHTAVYNGKPVVIKTLKPECQDIALAINEIESELAIHSRLNHSNIVSLVGAGTTSKGVRFFVLERLDGGTLSQRLGYDNRIRDRRKRFWRKKLFSYLDVLRIGKAIAEAMSYCHETAIPGCVVLHRDLKPDNIGFTLDGTVKILDFGLAKIVENSSIDSDDVYAMSGETGSLRYMSPEVAAGEPYNYSADVYSFGIILWEINALKKPFEGLSRDLFYERVVHGGERPAVSRKWPIELANLISECWDADLHNRPRFREIVARLDALLEKEKGGNESPQKKSFLPKISGMIDRHSTWF